MRSIPAFVTAFLVSFPGVAQNIAAAPTPEMQQVQVSVPRLIKIAGTLNGLDGQPRGGTIEVTFAIYKDQQGGGALWQETQTLTLDASGHYNVLLGESAPEGLPLDLFTSREARWLSVQIAGQPPETRTLLVSVPYALKAQEAESLGGTPASEFVTRSELQGLPQKSSPMAINSAAGASSSQAGGIDDGKQDNIALKQGSPLVTQQGLNGLGSASFSDTTSSAVINVNQSGTGSGINVSAASGTAGVFNVLQAGNPVLTGELNGQQRFSLDSGGNGNFAGNLTSAGTGLPAMGAATANAGFNSGASQFTASAYNSGTGTPVPQNFLWRAEPANNNTANAGGTLNLLFSAGANQPAETGVSIANNGLFTFASKQIFPGTVSSVAAADNSVVIGGTPSAPTVAVNGGSITAAYIAPGSVVKGINGQTDAITLTGANGLNVAGAGGALTVTSNATASNTPSAIVSRDPGGNFSAGTVTLGGTLALPSTTSSSVGVLTIGGIPFLHDFGSFNGGGTNTFVGVGAGNFSMTGGNNSGFGTRALSQVSTGGFNSAFGINALLFNTTGGSNSAFGNNALFSNTNATANSAFGTNSLSNNTTGSYNSAFGLQALDANTTASGNSAFGAFAMNSNTTGGANSAFGSNALQNNTSAVQNNAFGVSALQNNNGSLNNAFGYKALFSNTAGSGNSAFGDSALYFSTGGANNSAFGAGALQGNTSGSNNSAFGAGALVVNGSGFFNAAFGYDALAVNTATGSSAFGASALELNTSGAENSAFGYAALINNTTTSFNTAIGYNALYSNTGNSNTATGDRALYANTNGGNNTAIGTVSLLNNTSGNNNTAVGHQTLIANSQSSDNTAVGYEALQNNTAAGNTATGSGALNANTIGNGNAAYGYQALYSNTSSSGNAAFGYQALYSNNNNGFGNSAFGYQALYSSNSSGGNTGIGYLALYSDNTGLNNTANGADALFDNTSGSGNTAIGEESLEFNTTGSSNTAVGQIALLNLSSGANNIAIGAGAGDTLQNGSFDIYIGHQGVANESNTIRIGGPGVIGTYISGIIGKASANGTTVFINSQNQLGTTTSSRRYKHEIVDMAAESDVLMKLRPVSFYYKPELDDTQTRQYGLVAEEVAQVAPQLVLFNEDGKPETVRYHFVNAMLLNEVQKQSRELDRDKQRIANQEANVARLQADNAELKLRLASLDRELRTRMAKMEKTLLLNAKAHAAPGSIAVARLRRTATH